MKEALVGCGILIGAFVLVVIVTTFAFTGKFAGTYVEAFYNRTAGVELDNSKTDRMRESNQYISSVETRLGELAIAYHSTENPGQKTAIRNEMITLADRIPADRIPTSALAIIGGTR